MITGDESGFWAITYSLHPFGTKATVWIDAKNYSEALSIWDKRFGILRSNIISSDFKGEIKRENKLSLAL